MVVTSAGDEDFRSRIASSLLPDDQDCTSIADLLTDIENKVIDQLIPIQS
jgi:hypothetical protein